MNSSKTNSLLKSNSICAMAAILFAMGFPALDLLLVDWGFISIAFIRNAMGFILIFFIWLIAEGYRGIIKAKWIRGVIIGALGFGTGSLLLVITQVLTSTIVAGLAAALMPLAAVSLEVFFDKRLLTRQFLIGAALVLFGSFIIIGEDLLKIQFSLGLVVGLISVTTFAWGGRSAVKHLPEMSTLARTATTTLGMTLFCGSIQFIGLILDLSPTNIPAITLKHFGLLLIYSSCGLALSQILWIEGVKKLGVGIASFHLNITPFYLMIILVILGHNWEWPEAIGAGIVIFGVTFAQLSSNSIFKYKTFN